MAKELGEEAISQQIFLAPPIFLSLFLFKANSSILRTGDRLRGTISHNITAFIRYRSLQILRNSLLIT